MLDSQKDSHVAPYSVFDAEHVKGEIKGRAVRGGAVTMLGQGAQFVIQTVSTVILARLLTPADFGLVAMVTALTGFMTVLKDFGLSAATIQKDKITHEQISTLFWINVGVGAIICLITSASAPAIAWFYGEPRLKLITLFIQ